MTDKPIEILAQKIAAAIREFEEASGVSVHLIEPLTPPYCDKCHKGDEGGQFHFELGAIA